MRWRFDGRGRVDAIDNPLGHFDHQYESPSSPLLARVAAPSGLDVLYAYKDAMGDRRLSAITNLVNSAVVSAFGYKYDSADRIREWSVGQAFPPAIRMTVTHDSLDRLRSVVARDAGTSDLLQDYAYTYDPAGNRLTEKIGSSLVKAAHNDLNQITDISRGSTVEFGGSLNEPASVKINGQTAQHFATNAGDPSAARFQAAVTNLVQGSNTVTITATDGSGNAATNQYRVVVDPAATVALGYDPDGNMLTNAVAGSTHLYTWDSRNRLSRITRGSDVTEFAYDGLDRRIEIVELTGSATNAVRRFVWAGLEIAEERDAENATMKRFYPQGFQSENGQTENFLYTRDHLGSIRDVVDATGATRSAYAYDPWGRVTKVSGDIDSDFLYTGHLFHAGSCLHLAPYRAYAANLGRWLGRDPAKEVGSINLYAYGEQQPLSLRDPSGEECEGVFDRRSGTLQITDKDTGESVATTAYSGNGKHTNDPGSQHIPDSGPIPSGTYLIGTAYPGGHSTGGNNTWFPLYGDNGQGGYTHRGIPVPVPDPPGGTVSRGEFYIHTGRASNGCVTVPSDLPPDAPEYPKSEDFDKITKMLQKTSPRVYKGQKFSGTLIVK